MGCIAECDSDVRHRFPREQETNLLFNSNFANFLLKTNMGVTESLILFFSGLECYDCPGVVEAFRRKSYLGPAKTLKFFSLVCRGIAILLMTTVSLAPETTSDESIATYCTLSIVSTLVTSNLATTRMSHCLLHPWSLILQMTSKFLCNYEFYALPVLPCLHI